MHEDSKKKITDASDEDELVVEKIIEVDPGQAALRIDKFICDRLQGISRSRIQNAIKNEVVTVNDKTIKANYKVRPLDRIKLVIPKGHGGGHVEPEPIPLDILYEDDDLLIINKPAGLVVHPGVGNWTGTLVNGLLYHLAGNEVPVMAGNSADRAGLVHRIDKNTSGLLVVGKSDFALTHLAKQFYDHSIERTYLALIWGQPEPEKGTIDVPIGRHLKDRILHTAFPDGDMGKPAITHYELIEPMYYVSLARCQLETGRTHQIRVHMKYLGHPLFGDDRYGGDQIRKGTVFQKYKQFIRNCFELMPHQALHAATLSFVHPRTKEKMSFEAPLPSNFRSLLEKWRLYLANRKQT